MYNVSAAEIPRPPGDSSVPSNPLDILTEIEQTQLAKNIVLGWLEVKMILLPGDPNIDPLPAAQQWAARNGNALDMLCDSFWGAANTELVEYTPDDHAAYLDWVTHSLKGCIVAARSVTPRA